jgi:tetratricopeptide (TPR) repeat protein
MEKLRDRLRRKKYSVRPTEPSRSLPITWRRIWRRPLTCRLPTALRATDAGLAINPNSALLHAARGFPENNLGRFEQAKSDAQEAMRLSPRDPEIFWWHVNLGDAELDLRHFDAAIEEYQKVNVCNRGYCRYLDLAAAYALEGKMEEAKSSLAEARRVWPEVTIKLLQTGMPDVAPTWYEGLRKAGLPEE